MRLIVVLALFVALIAPITNASAQINNGEKTVMPLPIVKDADRDRLALLAAKLKMIEQQAQIEQMNFDKRQEALRNDYSRVKIELEEKANAVFAELKLSRDKYDVNLDTGKVFEIKPSGTQK